MFAVLGGFDKPFNQAPSLHIALLVVIWDHLRGRLPRKARLLWHLWCLLIGVSVLTTWQHHVIDIPTGMLLGLSAVWLFPRDAGSPLANFAMSGDPKSRRLGIYYLCGAVAFLGLGALCTPLSAAALLLLWLSYCAGDRRSRIFRRRSADIPETRRWPGHACQPLAIGTLPSRRSHQHSALDPENA